MIAEARSIVIMYGVFAEFTNNSPELTRYVVVQLASATGPGMANHWGFAP